MPIYVQDLINNARYDNLEDFLRLLTRLANCTEKLAFRGYSKENELLPKLIRDKDYYPVESQLLHDFEKFGSHYFSASTTIDFLSYAQHYGLPTRLLDFSYNPYIALCFALFEPKSEELLADGNEDYFLLISSIDNNIVLHGIPAYHYFTFGDFRYESIATDCYKAIREFSEGLCCDDDYLSMFLESLVHENQSNNGPLSSDEFRKEMDEKLADGAIVFIDPSHSNQRIIMQQGLFMLPYSLDKIKHNQIIQHSNYIIRIHYSLRAKLLKYLDTLGYDMFHLMPDLPSVCSAITRKYSEQVV